LVAFVRFWVLPDHTTVTEVVGVFVRFRAPLHSVNCRQTSRLVFEVLV
jgi:hypothetical protein